MRTQTVSKDCTLTVQPPSRVANRLLASLPSGDQERIFPKLTSRSLRNREVLQKQDELIHEVYFFCEGACSLVKVMQDGQSAEMASIGREGAVGAWAFFGDDRTLGDTLVYGGDAIAHALKIDVFKEEMARHGALYNLIIRYSQALTAQLMQTAVCNGLHSATQRCCRWLLAAQDRLQSSDFPVTHEFLASVLGVRRPTITLVFGDLLRRGVIEYRRGYIVIRDREALQACTCECHEQITARYRRLLPDVQPY